MRRVSLARCSHRLQLFLHEVVNDGTRCVVGTLCFSCELEAALGTRCQVGSTFVNACKPRYVSSTYAQRLDESALRTGVASGLATIATVLP